MSRLFPELDQVATEPAPSIAVLQDKLAELHETGNGTGTSQAPAATTAAVAEVGPSFSAQIDQTTARAADATDNSRTGEELPEKPVESVRVGSAACLAKFDAILGFPGIAANNCGVLAAKLHADGHIALDVEGGGVPRRVLWFWPKGHIPNPPLSGADFDIGVRGSTQEKIVGMMLAYVGKRLAKVPLKTLQHLLETDADARVELVGEHGQPATPKKANPDAESGKPKPEANLKMASLIEGWGDSDSWRSFFADDAQRRNFCRNNISGSVALVSHEDLECHFSTPSIGDGTMSFFNYPRAYDHYVGKDDAEDKTAPKTPQVDVGSRHLTTDLHDLDVIKGGASKLDRALESLLNEPVRPELIVVKATCVPVVIGDDMEASVEKFRKATNLPVVYVNDKEDLHSSPMRSTYRAVRGDLEFKHPVKRPGSINLLGFPRDDEMAPLLRFLEALGITINCRLLPEIDLKILKRYRAADLSVLSEAKLYDQSFEEIFGEIDVPVLRPTEPFGLARTRRCLYQIAEAMGKLEGFDTLWHAHFGEAERRYLAMQQEAVGFVLGFVVDATSLKILLEPQRSTGIPMLALIQEMGFTADFLVYVPPERTGVDPTLATLQSLGYQATPFSDPTGLNQELRNSRAQAFYSETYFDRRLTRSGKAQFSIAVAQVGVDGALASLERILAVCKMPFYRRYAGFLGRAFPTVAQPAS